MIGKSPNLFISLVPRSKKNVGAAIKLTSHVSLFRGQTNRHVCIDRPILSAYHMPCAYHAELREVFDKL